jgi:Cu/Ag efflux protein CusF
MKRVLGAAAAAAFVLSVAAAHADEATGVITQINPTDNSFMIGDQVFTASPQNTVGPTIKELKVGDKVTVFYERAQNGPVSNATSITLNKD